MEFLDNLGIDYGSLLIGIIGTSLTAAIPFVNRWLDKVTSFSPYARYGFEILRVFEDGKLSREEVNQVMSLTKELVRSRQ